MHDLAVRWNDGAHALRTIRAQKAIELHGVPKHLGPGRTVAVVQADGKVGLLFRCKAIVPLAKRCRIEAYARTIRSPRGNDPYRLSIKWRAIGQFRYFSARTHKPINISGAWRDAATKYLDDRVPPLPEPSFTPYGGSIPGREKNAPERDLVKRYVDWIGDERFDDVYLRAVGAYTDLFDRRHWRLFEAKIMTDRCTLREAVGQLLDYRRFFPRSPSLGVLLSGRPSNADIAYLRACGVTVIWETPTGRFSDSSEDRRWSLRTPR